MNKRIITVMLLVAAVTGCATRDAGAAVLSVDMIPGGAIDATLTKAPGDAFSVDILIGDPVDLGGFEFKLGFDPSILTATAVVSGGIFDPDTWLVDNTIDNTTLPGFVSFAELSLSAAGVSVDKPTVLATVHFTVSGLGTSVLDLRDTILAYSLGSAITPIVETDGELISNASPAPVPEPSALTLMSLGLIAGFVRSRCKARR